MLTRRRLMVIAGAACLAGPSAARSEWQGRAFGADASITLRGDGAEHALNAARDTIARMERLFSLFDPKSALSRLNRDGHLHMPPEFGALIAKIDEMHRVTEGLFDPTVQPIWKALSTGDLGGLDVHAVGWEYVHRDGQKLSFKRPGMALTLNGIAQGFATDRVKAVLGSFGFQDVVVNVGEYLVGSTPVQLGVANAEGQVFRSIQLQDEAAATSSPNALALHGSHNHILHPKDHRLPSIWDTVNVVASTATIADAVSTALALAPDGALGMHLKDASVLQHAVLKPVEGDVLEI